jgi:hypothetical protein
LVVAPKIAVSCCFGVDVPQVAYNLIYSLAQHTYDTDCNLFLRVRCCWGLLCRRSFACSLQAFTHTLPEQNLTDVSGGGSPRAEGSITCARVSFPPQVFSGEVDESVRHEQQLLEGEIMRMLKLLDMSINHQVCVLG